MRAGSAYGGCVGWLKNVDATEAANSPLAERLVFSYLRAACAFV
jgi:hypothetical protein